MRVRDELRGGIGLILAFQFVTAAAGIALLGRTGPAIESILAENDVSLEAAEAALVILSTPAPVLEADTDAEHAAEERAKADAARLAGLRTAVARLKANITEDGERPPVQALETDLAGAARRVPAAVSRFTASLAELTRINRASMRAADATARRAATTGAWALTTLALFSVAAGLVMLRRFHRRLVVGLGELHAVADIQRQGDPWRRVNTAGMAPELSAVGEALNALLEARTVREVRANTVPTARMAVLALLDARPEALVLLEPCGDVFASNALGIELTDRAANVSTLRDLDGVRVESLSRGFVLLRAASAETSAAPGGSKTHTDG